MCACVSWKRYARLDSSSAQARALCATTPMTKGEIDNNNNNNNKVNARLSCQKLLAANRRSMESFPSQSADAQQVARRRITSGQWLKSEFITQKRQVSPYQIGAVSELQRSEVRLCKSCWLPLSSGSCPIGQVSRAPFGYLPLLLLIAG